ncbi:zinc-binding dehydrogenase [Ornithinicoccus hortensis]|uniref:Alcohol dehydrogenase n=1 Tax=Ornithinicoccus hortensis TaxID=82346 RepID=A0A542YN97_9MICO|nr:alcohol dehydrogenase catalytic domain-containing protein [Ornithinicoccus hortensis]TQL49527.1 alcohol dehydrogenase [Ornithinicoccus hortensis]
MKALVFHGPGDKAWEEVPDPVIQDATDAIVRIDTTTICGTDLHILKGDVPAVTDGRILGHEAVGTVTEVGPEVSGVAVGDRVIVPAVTNCGECSYCTDGMPAHCQSVGGVGWIFGHLIDGLQAEFARVPFAGTSLVKVPEGLSDEQVLFLTDILPTGFELGVLNGDVGEGDTVAVIGAGPIGLAAIMTAGMKGASRIIAVDGDEFRLEAARTFGATDTIRAGSGDVAAQLKEMSPDGLGVHVAVEAVGIPETLDTCWAAIRPGGTVANVGVHGAPVELPIQDLWIQNITLRTGLVSGTTIPELLAGIQNGEIAPERFATHRFPLDQIMEAYDVFGNAAEHRALKVVLSAG